MTILLITNRYPNGPDDSASPFVPDFVGALRALGHRVIVLTPRYGTSAEQDDPDVFRFGFRGTGSAAPIGSWNVGNPRTWAAIARFLEAGHAAASDLGCRFAIDHILALWALPSGWFARRAARTWGAPYSVWCLGSDINVWARRPIFRGMTQRILREATCVFADGFRLAKAAQRLSGRRVSFLPTTRLLRADGPPSGFSFPRGAGELGIRPTRNQTSLSSETTWQCSGSGESRPYFLYAGRVHRDKGVFDLLRAFARIGPALGTFELVYVGDGPAQAKLREEVQRRGLSARVRVVGRVPVDRLGEYYRSAQATVLPSHADSLPLVFAEAVQCGSPLIVYDTGDLGRFVRRFRLGGVVPRGDIAALSRALIAATARECADCTGAETVGRLLHPQRAARRFLSAVARTAESAILGRTKICEGKVPAG